MLFESVYHFELNDFMSYRVTRVCLSLHIISSEVLFEIYFIHLDDDVSFKSHLFKIVSQRKKQCADNTVDLYKKRSVCKN